LPGRKWREGGFPLLFFCLMANHTVAEFKEKQRMYARAQLMLPWLIGDLCNEFLDIRGDEAWQYISDFESMGIGKDVLMDWISVSDRFEHENRLDGRKSIWYFREVYSLGAEDGVKWVQKAIDSRWTLQDLRKALMEAGLKGKK